MKEFFKMTKQTKSGLLFLNQIRLEKNSLSDSLRYGMYDKFLLFPSLRRFQRSKICQNWITESQDMEISNFPRLGNRTNPLF